jgi:ketosteroid isomerase-like protein
MSTQLTASDPKAVVERLHQAMNRHDLEAVLDCLDPNYHSEQPAHPARTFTGSDQAKKNWSTLFSSIPDFQAELVRSATHGDTIWTEWHWQGTQEDGTPLRLRGVIIFGVRDGRIAWGRLYMNEVEEDGADIDATVRRMAGKPSQER